MPPPYHPPVKRSLTIAGHETSVSLEPAFWCLLENEAQEQRVPLSVLVARVDAERLGAARVPNLASALRVFLLQTIRNKVDGANDSQ